MRQGFAAVLLAVLAGCGDPGPNAGPNAGPLADRAVPDPAPSVLYLGRYGPAPSLVPSLAQFRFQGDPARITLSSVSSQRLLLDVSCNGAAAVTAPDVLLGAGGDPPVQSRRIVPQGGVVSLTLGPGQQRDVWLQPASTSDRCTVQVSAGPARQYAITLLRAPAGPPPAAPRRAGAAGCPGPSAADALSALFHAPRALSMTAPLYPGPARILSDGRDAFQARVQALTGARMPDAVIDNGNIEAPIDFSNAPALDTILISALQMRADFTGAMLGRMLAWHAARGTRVQIMLTDSLLTRRDRRFFQALAARHPGIELRLYRLPPEGGGGALWHVDRLHRANHVKIFATLAQQSGRSVFMVGGRNFHDGFAFDSPRDLSSWPFLQQYDPDQRFSFAFFAVYRDLELAWDNDEAVRALVGHAETFFHRGHRATATPGAPAACGRAGRGVRHFISVPHADGRALEALFVALFDAAQHRLDLVSPFLNLPPLLQAALERAQARGVDIRLLTRTRVPEPAGIAVASYNRLFAEEQAGRMRVFDHRHAGQTLHSKVVIVDGRLSVVSSTNLNQRSFWHDTENGVLILDSAEARRLTALLDRYEQDSERQQGAQRVVPLLRWLLPLSVVRRFF
ncbi:MAG: phospholipase D-like domain-containing protein [Pararhodobacter sp.]